MPSWNRPAQSFKGHRLLQERHQHVPPESLEHQKIHHIGGCTFPPLEQDRTSMGNPRKNTGSSFPNTNSSQEESTSCRWRSCVPCSKTARKGTFFFFQLK